MKWYLQSHNWLVEQNLASDPAFSQPAGFVLQADPLLPPSTQLLEKPQRPCFTEELCVGLSPEISCVMDFPCATLGHPNLPAWIQLQFWSQLFYNNTSFETHLAQCLVQFQNVWIVFPASSPSFLSSRYYLYINECKNRFFKISLLS